MIIKFFVLCLLIPSSVFGEIYKWTDANGQVHYGEKSKGSTSKQVIVTKQKNNPGKSNRSEKQHLENIKKWTDARQQERNNKNREKKQLKKEKDDRKKKCKGISNDLKDMEDGGVLWYRLDDEGNRQFYSDKDIAAQKQALRKTLKKNCK
jgi:hypothetical protein